MEAYDLSVIAFWLSLNLLVWVGVFCGVFRTLGSCFCWTAFG